jgi:branched-chain amino acid transport system substrate-binding protein
VRSKVALQIAAVATCLGVVAACGSSSKSAGASTSPSSASPAGASSSAAGSSTPTGTPIKIGTIGVYSGFSSEESLPDPQALQAWASYTNAHGGLAGHPVQVIVKDDAGVPANSLAAAKDLIQNQHVVAIVGQDESGLEDVWAPYAASMKVPVIGGAANGASWLTNPNMFPAAGTFVNSSTGLVNVAKVVGKKNFSAIYCAEVPACAEIGVVDKGIATKLGLGFAGALSVSASATSYTAQCLALKGKGADSVFLASSIDVAIRFLGNCKQQGFNPTAIDDPRNWSAAQLKNPIWNGAILSSEGPLWFGSDPAIQTYLAAMKQYQPNTIGNSNGPLGWAAGVVFGDAVKAGGAAAGADVTSTQVYKGLYSLGPNFTAGGLMVPTTYTQGKPATQTACAWYAQVENGALTTPKGTGPICVGS